MWREVLKDASSGLVAAAILLILAAFGVGPFTGPTAFIFIFGIVLLIASCILHGLRARRQEARDAQRFLDEL